MSAHRARKRFGQHFLTDPGVIDAILDVIHPAGQDIVVEIGPGHGAITDGLAGRSSHLHAIKAANVTCTPGKGAPSNGTLQEVYHDVCLLGRHHRFPF